MKKLTLITTLLNLPIIVFAQDTWVEDPAHSKLGFTVKHLGIADANTLSVDNKIGRTYE